MHQDEGHYAGKHPGVGEVDENAAAVLKKYITNGRISCSDAHAAAAEAGAGPAEIGRTVDLMEIRINACQLGLFGYKDREKVGFGIPGNEAVVSAEVKKHIRNGGINCLNLWKAADISGCTRMEAAAVCEKEGIKITDCQLGAF